MGHLTAYGHSWVHGDGASTPAHRMVDVAADQLGLVPRNLGVGGSSSTQTAALVRRQAPPRSRAFVLMAGLNDARLHGCDAHALTRYLAAVRAILTAFRVVEPGAVVLLVEQPHLLDYSRHAPHDRGSDEAVDAYNQALRAAATYHPRTVLAVASGWDRATMLAEDTVHPNDLGHALLGRAVADAYRSAASTMASTNPVHD